MMREKKSNPRIRCIIGINDVNKWPRSLCLFLFHRDNITGRNEGEKEIDDVRTAPWCRDATPYRPKRTQGFQIGYTLPGLFNIFLISLLEFIIPL